MELEVIFAIIIAKQLIFGGEFSFVKWIKHRKSYWITYNQWLKNKP
tara:strand:- start:552 stop:689 length:138 start_codon:yes stop_codon:yes gene_type:complete